PCAQCRDLQFSLHSSRSDSEFRHASFRRRAVRTIPAVLPEPMRGRHAVDSSCPFVVADTHAQGAFFYENRLSGKVRRSTMQ
ncbi:MAG: hypothetical protein JXR49_15745, partial [Acidobacteria bacterium]|nr:hypothetical protein [Acidobacteriota bacterium]